MSQATWPEVFYTYIYVSDREITGEDLSSILSVPPPGTRSFRTLVQGPRVNIKSFRPEDFLQGFREAGIDLPHAALAKQEVTE